MTHDEIIVIDQDTLGIEGYAIRDIWKKRPTGPTGRWLRKGVPARDVLKMRLRKRS